MNRYLLVIAIGPVQDMIAAARRTRDLWFGSYLLSEISKAAAKALSSHGARLIFPAPREPDDLHPDSALNVANLILVECDQPRELATMAKKAAQERWLTFSAEVFESLKGFINPNLWEDQVPDILEFYAAWQLLSNEDYKGNRKKLMALLHARKSSRDFLPAKGHAGIPKSSLDGMRESVIATQTSGKTPIRNRLRLQEGEQLDVLGLVKRHWSNSENATRYPSVSRIAADPWIRGLPEQARQKLRACCEEGDRTLFVRLDVSETTGQPHFKAFPYEATALYQARHPSLIAETGRKALELAPLNVHLDKLYMSHGEPNPYFALLIADGDQMGEALGNLKSADEHRAFSKDLAGFAAGTRKILADHNGLLVYAGGDDVMAFVPLDQCLACAHTLSLAFSQALKGWGAQLGDFSLSVGIAIGHFMEPLEDLLGYARAAEKHAKQPTAADKGQQPRNALAIHVHKRGGEPLYYRAHWINADCAKSAENSENNESGEEKREGPEKHLMKLAGWLADEALSNGIAQDLQQIAKLYRSWPTESQEAAIQADVLSVIGGKNPAGISQITAFKKLIQARVKDSESLQILANELLLARQLAAALKQAKQEQT